MSAGLFQLACLTSWYHACNGCAASGCISQNSRSVFRDMIRTTDYTTIPYWEQAQYGGLGANGRTQALRLWRRFSQVGKLPPPKRKQIVQILDAFLGSETAKKTG